MASAAGVRPNHYDILGLGPEATQDEIERAFRHELNPFVPHLLGGVAAASVAYATLRDPVKRRAYDEALGLIEPPAKAAEPRLLAAGDWSIGRAHALHAVPRPATPTETRPAGEPVKAAPFIAAPAPSRSSAAETAPPVAAAGATQRPQPLAAARPAPADKPRPAPVILGMDEAEDGAIDGRKGLVLLGVVGSVAMIGGMLGWFAGSDAGDATANAALTAPLPKQKAQDLTMISPVPATAEAPPLPAQAPRFQRRVRPHSPSPIPPAQAGEAQVTEPIDTLAPTGGTVGPEPAIAAAETPRTAAAMPLSGPTVARTIDRIGYSCGSVTGTESSGGGVYTVTCASGQRFRASPRSGRYRFKRL